MNLVMTITLGEIVVAVIFLCGIVANLIAMRIDLAVLKVEVRSVKDLVMPVVKWFGETIGPARYKTDDELLHDKRGIEHVLGMRDAMRKAREPEEAS